MSQQRKLLSTAADSPDDDSDYTVQTAQNKLERKIFWRKLLICICVFSCIVVIVAAVTVVVVYFATDSKNKNDHSSSHSIPSSSSMPSSSLIPSPTPSPTPSPSNGTENSKILDYIDTSYDPCEDFYNYSCGGWHSNQSYTEWGTFDELAIDNYNKLAGYLSQYVSSDDPTAIKKAKYIYSACTDTDYISDHLTTQMDSFMSKAGGWHNGDFSPYDSWLINDNLYNDHYLGSSAFFSFGIYPDDLNSTKQVIRVTSMHAYALVQA